MRCGENEDDTNDFGVDESQSSTVEVVSKKLKKRPCRSFIYEYFTELDKDDKGLSTVRCNLCNLSVTMVNGTTSTIYHLKSHHKITSPLKDKGKLQESLTPLDEVDVEKLQEGFSQNQVM